MKPSCDILASFGLNGSLRKMEIQMPVSNHNVEYYLFNSSANMKAYSYDKTDFAYYGYNAANTRTYKLSMLNQNQWVNGQLVSLLFLCSPKESLRQASKKELVRFLEREQTSPKVTEQKERAFAAVEKNPVHNARQLAERRYPLCSHRSAPLPCYGRRIFFITPQVCDMTLTTREIQRLQQWQDATLSSEVPPCNLLFSFLCFVSFFFSGRRKKERNEGKNFYYHTNHLGSTAFVTDQNQNITQGFLYAPFGEITTEYDINFGYNVLPKYSFNAKELDEETGMYYYEARYYKPPVFTSRDAMFEKYFWMTPYAYCANNPVKYVDPDGKAPGDPFKTKKKAAKDWAKFYNGASILRGHEFASSIYITTINGKRRYTYSEAAEGTSDESYPSLPPNGEKIVADIHSHGKYDEEYCNNEFSQEDKNGNDEQKIDGYVSTPNGSLIKYNYKTGKVTVVSNKMDSDPNDPKRKNKKNPVDIPKKIEDAFNLINSIEIEFNIESNFDYFQ